jgi:hypothetical protein
VSMCNPFDLTVSNKQINEVRLRCDRLSSGACVRCVGWRGLIDCCAAAAISMYCLYVPGVCWEGLWLASNAQDVSATLQ